MYGGHNRRTQPGDDVNRTNAGEEFKPYLELHGELTGIPPPPQHCCEQQQQECEALPQDSADLFAALLVKAQDELNTHES